MSTRHTGNQSERVHQLASTDRVDVGSVESTSKAVVMMRYLFV